MGRTKGAAQSGNTLHVDERTTVLAPSTLSPSNWSILQKTLAETNKSLVYQIQVACIGAASPEYLPIAHTWVCNQQDWAMTVLS